MFVFFVLVKLVQSYYWTGDTDRAVFVPQKGKKKEDAVIIFGDMVMRELVITTQNNVYDHTDSTTMQIKAVWNLQNPMLHLWDETTHSGRGGGVAGTAL